MSRWHHPSRAVALWLGILPLLALTVFISRQVDAHPESVSQVRMVLTSSGMHATLVLPVRDLSRWFPPGRYKNYTADVVRELGNQAGDLLLVAWDEQRQQPSHTIVHPGTTGFIIVEADYVVPADAAALAVRSLMLPNLPNDHQQLVLVEDGRRGKGMERILADQTLTAQQDTLQVDVPEAPPVAAGTMTPVGASSNAAPASEQPLVTPRISFFHPSPTQFVTVLLVFVVIVVVAVGGYLSWRGRIIDSARHPSS
jgi:hypothetical protein